MIATKAQMKAEAINRMKMLGIYWKAIEEFRQEDKVNVSRSGILYWLDETYREKVAEFEKEHGGLAYIAIEINTEFGKLLSILYVSEHCEEWERDREELKDCTPFAYVYNLTDEYCSEFGCIGVRNRFGGLVRTA